MTISRGWLALAIAAAGCGGARVVAPPTEPVSGTVLFRGKPAAGVRVTLHPRFDMGAIKFAPSGLTGPDGRFTLSTAVVGDGAPPGDYAVTFGRPRATTDKSGLDSEADAWSGKYADAAANKWPATVGPGKNDLGPFRLE